MATKEHSTHEVGACVCDCQSYRVKPAIFWRVHLKDKNLLSYGFFSLSPKIL